MIDVLRKFLYKAVSFLQPPRSTSSSGGRLLLPTRTSPRKRLTLSDSPPQRSPQQANLTPSPEKAKRSPISKKYKMGLTSSPASASSLSSSVNSSFNSSVDPMIQMKGLSPTQVLNVVSKLLQSHPDLQEEVAEMLPVPDLGPLEEKLHYLKRNIFKSLPNTRLESKTDSLAYNRVSTHLLAFKKVSVANLKYKKYPCNFDHPEQFLVLGCHRPGQAAGRRSPVVLRRRLHHDGLDLRQVHPGLGQPAPQQRQEAVLQGAGHKLPAGAQEGELDKGDGGGTHGKVRI